MAFGIAHPNDLADDVCDAGLEPRYAVRVGRLGGSALSRDQVIIPASGTNGFDIYVHRTAHGASADFGGLSQDFSTFDEALNWAERAVLEDYRLRIDYAGANPWRWTLEKLVRDGGVIDIFSSGYIVLFRSLRKQSVMYRQNLDPQTIN